MIDLGCEELQGKCLAADGDAANIWQPTATRTTEADVFITDQKFT